MLSFVQEFGILFLIIVGVSFVVKLMKQPIIIGYVLSGLIFSFLVAAGSSSEEKIIILSELGITFLLFLMGLEFDLKNLRYLGKDILVVTTIQSIIFFIVSIGPAFLFGFSARESVYLAILFMFSSTLLVAKWLEDRKETSTLRGKIVLGILVLQDLFAIIAMTVLSAVQEKAVAKMLLVPAGGLVLLLTAFIFARYLLNALLRFAVRYPELLFISSLGVCFFFVELSPLLGYSTTIGAFIAGVTLANTNYKSDIYGRLRPLIIFFNMLFFVGLGFQVSTSIAPKAVLFITLTCILSFLIKPVIVYLTLKMRGYDLKTSFVSGLDLAQLSEFGIIIIASGVLGGLISKEISTIAIISFLFTMVVSSYMIKYDSAIFKFLERHLRKIDRLFPKRESKEEQAGLGGYNVIFFGYYDLGKELFSKLDSLGKKVLVIEKDPANIEMLKKEGIPYSYNSVTNPYFFKSLDFKKADLVVSSLIDIEDNKMIITQVKRDNPNSVIIVTSKSLKNSLELYDKGADYVIYPAYINEQQVSVLLEDYTTDISKVIAKKVNDLTRFKEMDKKREALKPAFDINKFLEKLPRRSKINLKTETPKTEVSQEKQA